MARETQGATQTTTPTTPLTTSGATPMLIQFALAAWGLKFTVDTGIDTEKHAQKWLELATNAKGDPKQIQLASIEFIRMAEGFTFMLLAATGVRANVTKGLRAKAEPFGTGVERPAAEPGSPNDWEGLGMGMQSHARAHGKVVLKRLRAMQFNKHRVTKPQLVAQAKMTAVLNGHARTALGNVVPEMWVPREGAAILAQERVDGLSWDQIETMDTSVQTRARKESSALIARLNAYFAATKIQPTEDVQWGVDPSISNFKFSAEGAVLHWFDPVVVLQSELFDEVQRDLFRQRARGEEAAPPTLARRPPDRLFGANAARGAASASADLDPDEHEDEADHALPEP